MHNSKIKIIIPICCRKIHDESQFFLIYLFFAKNSELFVRFILTCLLMFTSVQCICLATFSPSQKRRFGKSLPQIIINKLVNKNQCLKPFFFCFLFYSYGLIHYFRKATLLLDFLPNSRRLLIHFKGMSFIGSSWDHEYFKLNFLLGKWSLLEKTTYQHITSI